VTPATFRWRTVGHHHQPGPTGHLTGRIVNLTGRPIRGEDLVGETAGLILRRPERPGHRLKLDTGPVRRHRNISGFPVHIGDTLLDRIQPLVDRPERCLININVNVHPAGAVQVVDRPEQAGDRRLRLGDIKADRLSERHGRSS
jgi:hypothetical protein